MKNVAKCDTWCELQNPANHRVFERKLRPRPSGRGHACLGVTPTDTPTPSSGVGCGVWLPVPEGAVGRSWGCRHTVSGTARGGRLQVVLGAASRHAASLMALRTHVQPKRTVARTATPGQAGLPAEFKHINKRRRRNLQGFP
jgi:hypothetical protein